MVSNGAITCARALPQKAAVLVLMSRQDEAEASTDELLSNLRQVHSNEGTNRVDTNGLLIFDSALTSEMHAGEEMVS